MPKPSPKVWLSPSALILAFDTGTRSFPYVALWSQDKKVLETNLAAIREVSSKIIDALEQTANKMVGVA